MKILNKSYAFKQNNWVDCDHCIFDYMHSYTVKRK